MERVLVYVRMVILARIGNVKEPIIVRLEDNVVLHVVTVERVFVCVTIIGNARIGNVKEPIIVRLEETVVLHVVPM
jgi:hypothetical protein